MSAPGVWADGVKGPGRQLQLLGGSTGLSFIAINDAAAGARLVVGFRKASLNRRVRGHEIPIADAVA